MGTSIYGNVIREHPLSTYAKFSGFWTPSPPLVRFSRNLSVLSYAKIDHFFYTPLPLSAYVLYGWSLSYGYLASPHSWHLVCVTLECTLYMCAFNVLLEKWTQKISAVIVARFHQLYHIVTTWYLKHCALDIHVSSIYFWKHTNVNIIFYYGFYKCVGVMS